MTPRRPHSTRALARRLRAGLAALLLVPCIGVSASAQSEDKPFAPTGPYVSLGFGAGLERFDSGSVNDGLAFNGRGGYRFLPWLAAEVEYEWVPRFDITSGLGLGTDIATHVVTANAKAIWVNETLGPFQPFAIGGVGAMIADAGPAPTRRSRPASRPAWAAASTST